MSSFLATFLRVAKSETKAERGMAVDLSMSLVDAVNLTEDKLNSEVFQEVAIPNLNRAMEMGEAIITNNMITDPTQAPVTKTSFQDLRVIVVIPVAERGAVYLDQPIRLGIIARDIIDNLMRTALYCIENNLESLSEADMQALCRELKGK